MSACRPVWTSVSNRRTFQLETVVVTALGIKKAEKSLGYSLQQVNSDAFDKVKTDNPINALNGKVAGLTVNTRAGILEDPPIKCCVARPRSTSSTERP